MQINEEETGKIKLLKVYFMRNTHNPERYVLLISTPTLPFSVCLFDEILKQFASVFFFSFFVRWEEEGMDGGRGQY